MCRKEDSQQQDCPKQKESYCHLQRQRRLKDSLSDFPAISIHLMILMDETNLVISGLWAFKWESQPPLSRKARKRKKNAWRHSGFYTSTPRADMPTSRLFHEKALEVRVSVKDGMLQSGPRETFLERKRLVSTLKGRFWPSSTSCPSAWFRSRSTERYPMDTSRTSQMRRTSGEHAGFIRADAAGSTPPATSQNPLLAQLSQ